MVRLKSTPHVVVLEQFAKNINCFFLRGLFLLLDIFCDINFDGIDIKVLRKSGLGCLSSSDVGRATDKIS
jgi:hypothetical protein